MSGFRRRKMKRRVSISNWKAGDMTWIEAKGLVSKEDEELFRSIVLEVMTEVIVGSSPETPKLGLIGRKSLYDSET